MNRLSRTAHGGFSLIEVMVSLVISLVATLMIVSIYSSTRQSHVKNDRIGEVLENGRFAMYQIANDLQSIGFVGGVLYPEKIVQNGTLSLAIDCGKPTDVNWAYDLTSYGFLQSLYMPTHALAAADHQCLSAAEFSASKNLVMIKRVFGQKETGALVNNAVYLRSDNANACLWFHSAATPAPTGSNCPTAGFDDWRYLVNLYFIRPFSQTAGDGIPTLCKKTLSVTNGATPQPAMQTVCLAEGIEQFNIEFGIDTDATRDGVANHYMDNPALSDLQRAVSARIHVLARARVEHNDIGGSKTYTLGNLSVSSNDKYFRRVYSTTVMLKNPSNLAGMQ